MVVRENATYISIAGKIDINCAATQGKKCVAVVRAATNAAAAPNRAIGMAVAPSDYVVGIAAAGKTITEAALALEHTSHAAAPRIAIYATAVGHDLVEDDSRTRDLVIGIAVYNAVTGEIGVDVARACTVDVASTQENIIDLGAAQGFDIDVAATCYPSVGNFIARKHALSAAVAQKILVDVSAIDEVTVDASATPDCAIDVVAQQRKRDATPAVGEAVVDVAAAKEFAIVDATTREIDDGTATSPKCLVIDPRKHQGHDKANAIDENSFVEGDSHLTSISCSSPRMKSLKSNGLEVKMVIGLPAQNICKRGKGIHGKKNFIHDVVKSHLLDLDTNDLVDDDGEFNCARRCEMI
ncbi:hypothetical protein ACH5RR_008652 [Cinchona calisaya]|uniref:Uncharacterized protein n=1 Tax=Cinchona calisaya TaxID=153742 RepID=A0ABD3AFK7_9GENT